MPCQWPDEVARFFTVDVQESIFWGTIRQWSKDGRSRRVWFGRLTSYAEIEQRRVEFGVKPGLVAIDSGHRAKGDSGVYAACVRYGWIALKGDPDKAFWHKEKDKRVQHSFSERAWGDPEIGIGGDRRILGKKAPLIRFSSDMMADRMDQLISTGRWIEPVTEAVPGLPVAAKITAPSLLRAYAFWPMSACVVPSFLVAASAITRLKCSAA